MFIVSMLCVGFSAAQSNEAAKYDVIEAASDAGLGTFATALNSTGLADTLNNQGMILLELEHSRFSLQAMKPLPVSRILTLIASWRTRPS